MANYEHSKKVLEEFIHEYLKPETVAVDSDTRKPIETVRNFIYLEDDGTILVQLDIVLTKYTKIAIYPFQHGFDCGYWSPKEIMSSWKLRKHLMLRILNPHDVIWK